MKYQTLNQLFEAGVANLRNRSIGALYQSIRGAASETTLRRNQAALALQALRQHTLRDVSKRSIVGNFLGYVTPIPVMVAPWGGHQIFHDSGEIGTAKGAGDNFMAMATASNRWPKEVIEVSDGPRIFQLYLFAGGAWLDHLIEQIIDLGFAGIVLTVDTQVISRRDPSIELPASSLLNFPTPLLDAAFNDPSFDPSFPLMAASDWAQVTALQDKIGGRVPFGIKGITTPEDALRAKQAGIDFIWVSNHGGRQLDYGEAAIDVLPAIVQAVKPGAGQGGQTQRWPHFPNGWSHDHLAKPQIVVDSGFRRGTDVLQALALGADMVAMGKTFQMALAADGEEGVASAFELLSEEIDVNLALTGHSNVYDLGPRDITRIDYPVARESIDRTIEELDL
jgi:isopentenyl diphosphate isomerase/L-lactate dehydrogenase-like FMN-dependent dehydrogenase